MKIGACKKAFLLLILLSVTCLLQAQSSVKSILSSDICACIVAKKASDKETIFTNCFMESMERNNEMVMDSLMLMNTDSSEEKAYQLGLEMFANLSVSLANDCAGYRLLMEDLRWDGVKALNLDSVKTSLATLEKKKPLEMQDLTDRGMAYFITGSYPKALSDFDSVLRQKKDDPAALYFKAWTLEQLGNYKEAATLYRRLVDLTAKAEFRIFEAIATKKAQQP